MSLIHTKTSEKTHPARPGTGLTGTPHQAPPDTVRLLPVPLLTSRQQEVLSLLCEGLPDKLIARKLDLSHHTVRGHVQKLYGLLRVSNRMQAMFAARQSRLIL